MLEILGKRFFVRIILVGTEDTVPAPAGIGLGVNRSSQWIPPALGSPWEAWEPFTQLGAPWLVRFQA
jgi:hypothetical protein